MLHNSILHLVLEGSAEGCLSAACKSFRLPGVVHAIEDDFSHGPLENGPGREKYLRDCYHGYSAHQKKLIIDTLAPWVALNEKLHRKSIEQVCIWAGENASEKTFSGMVCWNLRLYEGSITTVGATGLEPPPYIAAHSPKVLANLFTTRELLNKNHRTVLVDSFIRTRDEALILRRWDDGEVISVAENYYDSLLIRSCSTEWRIAARIVGEAMSRCDDNNLIGDVFLTSRLQYLIDNNIIQSKGVRNSLREYWVRLP